MKTVISHSQVNTYTQCARKYYYHYKKRYRSPVISGALLFGSALDSGLNELLKTRDIDKAKNTFVDAWNTQFINNVKTSLPSSTIIVYAEKDYDSELITELNQEQFKQFCIVNKIETDKTLKQLVAFYRELKKEKGFANLSDNQKKVYNFGHWCCLLNKGLILIDAYNKHVMPKIKEVYAIQEKVSLQNSEGDEVVGYADIVFKWEDDKIYVGDNKSSTRRYEEDSAMKSQQLILYHHALKEKYKINGGASFFVLYKQILKNKLKICTVCGFNGSETTHKTCNNEINGKRCKGEWDIKINPEGEIEPIFNQIPEAAENLVIETFDQANQGIKKEVFNPNLSACGSTNSDYRCPFYDLCWKGKDDELIVLPERKKE